MTKALQGKSIAVVATNGFEQSELIRPVNALRDAGAVVDVISPKPGSIRGWDQKNWGKDIPIDHTIADADPADYDALLLPGGVMNPDHLRMDPNVVKFVQAFVDADKPISAICHGPWTLIECHRAVQGKTMTSWPSLKTDLKNAGANWVDQEVVVDGRLVTSRKPDDIPAFIEKTIDLIKSVRPSAHAASSA